MPLLLRNSPATGVIAELSPSNKHLFQYFVERASYSIGTFGKDAQRIPEILTRMAISDNTPSCKAVLKSSLALASFHRDNAVHATARYKGAALRALAESTQGLAGVADSACHIAAGIILCTLEIQQNSTTSSHWLWYACGATKIVKTAGLDEIEIDEDLTALVGWVHYFNTMAKFSLRHWQPNFILDPDNLADIGFDTFHPAVCSNGQPANLKGFPHEILYLLTEVFNSVTVVSDPCHGTKEYKSHLQALDWELQNIGNHVRADVDMGDEEPVFNMAVELHRLSTLIYLRRASAGILNLDKGFNDWIDQAFILLAHLPSCQWPFPLFIFGCEARDDERRLVILDLIHRTTKDGRYRNLAPIKNLIETIWVQQDLLDENLDYVRKLGVILSSTQRSVPAFL
ncbi:arginine metabolism regulation ii [Fusarium longipes]|uniref:Arginine metabolism regulation ii n=1 Tax=Fusarium longipes TaxID=694270 RepID=A0A395SL58_9HYPO|nr:arginine metabolism regulation ii [Fusarium longipes]